MFKRWVTQEGDKESLHKSMEDAVSGRNKKINVIEMVGIDVFDAYAEALKSPDKDDCYLKAYRAGWNDALEEVQRKANQMKNKGN